MNVTHHSDVASLLAHASPFLVSHEAHNNLILGLCVELRHSPTIYGEAPLVLRTVENQGVVILTALQTPPHKLVLSYTEQLAACDVLARDLATVGNLLPGVAGPRLVAEAFAHAWATASGQRSAAVTDQRIYQLTQVRPPTPVPGQLRRATEGDRALLEEWFAAFQREAMGETNPTGIDRAVTRWLTSASRYLALWEDAGPVAMAGATGPTPHGIRIGAVYTPPQQRRRGYASALVAALSQAQLDAGKRCCFLYTDLANPTSNHIYQAIGYEPVVEIAELRFGVA